jgi:Na+-translocating ferredoxin:NAD+ oxidoreductase subunit E
MRENRTLTIFRNGLIDENPIFRLLLGLCPTLAVTTSASNGLGMGLAATFVLVCSNVVISLLRNFIPEKVRIPAFIVVIATFVTIVQLLMQAYLPALFEALGLFIPLIVVNCIILGRAESFASKNGVYYSLLDGIAMGLGFTIALIIIASFREVLGNGSIFGVDLFGSRFKPVLLMILSPGGFLSLGLIMAFVNKISEKGGNK